MKLMLVLHWETEKDLQFTYVDVQALFLQHNFLMKIMQNYYSRNIPIRRLNRTGSIL